MTETNPVELTAALVRCPSVTPEEGGALTFLQDLLEGAGFTCTRVDRDGICNLFARWGDKGHARTFGFNGHTDVVPLGNPDDWSMPPMFEDSFFNNKTLKPLAKIAIKDSHITKLESIDCGF